MIPYGAIISSYLVAAVLFILSLGGLSTQKTARRGNLYGIIGMALAVAATTMLILGKVQFPEGLGENFSGVLLNDPTTSSVFAVVIGLGALIGAILAARVGMTSMPELVAILHSFVGLAAVLVGISTYMGSGISVPV
ncbi:MAG: NAD(P)(+) transhydrogenase (Re/Si-specific) subunit beta, partial [bacterium]